MYKRSKSEKSSEKEILMESTATWKIYRNKVLVSFLFLLQDILNHILGDIEIFVGQLSAVAAQSAKKKKKSKKCD